jgi:hypothetical protein
MMFHHTRSLLNARNSLMAGVLSLLLPWVAAGGGFSAWGAGPRIPGRQAPRSEAVTRGWVAWAEAQEGEPGLRLAWWGLEDEPIQVRRAPYGTTNFTTVLEARGVREYLDRDVTPGERYVYRVRTGPRPPIQLPVEMECVAGWRVAPLEDRGVVALLVDETLAGALTPELDRLRRELVADGWGVIQRSVPRHDDREWSNNTNAIARIREQVRADWEASGRRLKALYLIGHVAVPYSGIRAEDLHTGRGDNHWGAWPSDQYYGDVDGIWTDRDRYPSYLPEPTFVATRNVPGDGKFDTEHVPPNADGEIRLEMAFGRVDFSGMPSFGRGQRAEVDLLRQYMDKVRRYRQGGMPVRRSVVAAGYFGNATDLDLLSNAYRTGSRLFGAGPEAFVEADLFELSEREAAAWGFQSGPGTISSIRNGSPGAVTASRLSSPRRQARVLFAMLLGSWFGDWAVGEDNLLRAVIASRDHGLAAFWVRNAQWRFDPLALGGTLGDAQLTTANELLRRPDHNLGTTRTLTILGDPTLRLHVVEPVRGLRGQRRGGGVRLSWAEGGTGVLGWNVYRSTNGWAGPYQRSNRELVTEREYLDPEPPNGAVYMVRAARLETTGSGSYTNLSLGVFWP